VPPGGLRAKRNLRLQPNRWLLSDVLRRPVLHPQILLVGRWAGRLHSRAHNDQPERINEYARDEELLRRRVVHTHVQTDRRAAIRPPSSFARRSRTGVEHHAAEDCTRPLTRRSPGSNPKDLSRAICGAAAADPSLTLLTESDANANGFASCMDQITVNVSTSLSCASNRPHRSPAPRTKPVLAAEAPPRSRRQTPCVSVKVPLYRLTVSAPVRVVPPVVSSFTRSFGSHRWSDELLAVPVPVTFAPFGAVAQVIAVVGAVVF